MRCNGIMNKTKCEPEGAYYCNYIYKTMRKNYIKSMIKAGIPGIIIHFILKFRQCLYRCVLKNKFLGE